MATDEAFSAVWNINRISVIVPDIPPKETMLYPRTWLALFSSKM
jgi:hypothetical protein